MRGTSLIKAAAFTFCVLLYFYPVQALAQCGITANGDYVCNNGGGNGAGPAPVTLQNFGQPTTVNTPPNYAPKGGSLNSALDFEREMQRLRDEQRRQEEEIAAQQQELDDFIINYKPNLGGGNIDFNANQLDLPECNDPNALVISSPAELNLVNNSGGASVICFDGDFSNETLTISSSGTKDNPLIIRGLGTKFKNIVFENKASHLIIDSVHMDKQGELLPQTVIKGQNVTLNNSLFENTPDVLIKVLGKDVTIQNSILRDSVPIPNTDSNCIAAFPGADNLRVINNEIKDCAGDGIQILAGVWEGLQAYESPANVVIEGNHIYITDQLRQGDGTACAENALDIKAGKNILVKNNVMNGFRKTDPSCAGSGSWGVAVIIHRDTQSVTLEDNTIYDVPETPGAEQCVSVTSYNATLEQTKPKDVRIIGDHSCQTI